MSACKKSVAWWWLCMMALSLPIDTQQQSQEDAYEKCYNLTTTRHCFMTDRSELLKSFADASSWCKSQGYSLVRIENADVQVIVEQFLVEFELISDNVWIGANRSSEGQWTWVNGDVYDDGNSLEKNKTDAGIAYLDVNSASSPYRLFADSYGTRQYYMYICKFSEPICGRYAGKEGYFDGGLGTCYVTFPKHNQRAKNNWFMARNKCLMEGGDLADEGAINLSLPLNSGPSKNKYLVGLRRDEFVWIESGQRPAISVNWTRFLPSEPSSSNFKKCVSLSYISQWAWATVSCTEPLLFVCEKVEPRTDLSQYSTVEPTRSTTIDVNAPKPASTLEESKYFIALIILSSLLIVSLFTIVGLTIGLLRIKGKSSCMKDPPYETTEMPTREVAHPVYTDLQRSTPEYIEIVA